MSESVAAADYTPPPPDHCTAHEAYHAGCYECQVAMKAYRAYEHDHTPAIKDAEPEPETASSEGDDLENFDEHGDGEPDAELDEEPDADETPETPDKPSAPKKAKAAHKGGKKK